MPVEVVGVAPGALLDALNRAEAVALTGLFAVALIGGLLVLIAAWAALQGMRR